MDHQFRTAAFGGFNRQDVLDYLASSALANQQQLQAVQEQLDQSRKELEAHRRAQNVLDEAKLQARRVRQQTHQWLNQMVQEYNTLRRQLDAALTSAGKQLDQVGQTLSKQDGAFDQLREAYAKTDPDRKPAPTPLNDD